jgi:predicted Zn-dependent protease
MYSEQPEEHWAFTSAFEAGILPLLEKSPGGVDPEFLGELAIAYQRRNMRETSETLMQRAPRATHTIVARALMARARGEFNDADLLAHLDVALEYQPGAHELRVLRAQTRLSVQQFELALEDARIALLQRSDDPRAFETQAVAFMALGRFEEAQTALASLHPSEYSANRPALWLLAGRLATLRGDPSRAAAEYERYVEANPLKTFGWAQLAIAYEQTGQPESAARARRNSGRVFYRGGIKALDRGDSARATQLLALALEFDPGYEPAARALAGLQTAPEASGEIRNR